MNEVRHTRIRALSLAAANNSFNLFLLPKAYDQSSPHISRVASMGIDLELLAIKREESTAPSYTGPATSYMQASAQQRHVSPQIRIRGFGASGRAVISFQVAVTSGATGCIDPHILCLILSVCLLKDHQFEIALYATVLRLYSVQQDILNLSRMTTVGRGFRQDIHVVQKP